MAKPVTESVDYLTPRQGFDRGWEGGRAFERERCAKIAEGFSAHQSGGGYGSRAENDKNYQEIAAAIRKAE